MLQVDDQETDGYRIWANQNAAPRDATCGYSVAENSVWACAACVRAAPPAATQEGFFFFHFSSLSHLIASGITVPYALHDSLLLLQSPDLDQELSARRYRVMKQTGTAFQNIRI